MRWWAAVAPLYSATSFLTSRKEDGGQETTVCRSFVQLLSTWGSMQRYGLLINMYDSDLICMSRRLPASSYVCSLIYFNVTPYFDLTEHPLPSSWRQAPGQSQPTRYKQKYQCDVKRTNLATAFSFRRFRNGNSLKSGSLKKSQQRASEIHGTYKVKTEVLRLESFNLLLLSLHDVRQGGIPRLFRNVRCYWSSSKHLIQTYRSIGGQ